MKIGRVNVLFEPLHTWAWRWDRPWPNEKWEGYPYPPIFRDWIIGPLEIRLMTSGEELRKGNYTPIDK